MYGKGKVEPLIDRTLHELNLSFDSLAMGSCKKVYVRCLRCGEEFLRERRLLHQRHHCASHVIRSDGLKLKWCNKCGDYLPYASFSANAARHDGLNSICKTCATQTPSSKRHNAKRRIANTTLAGWIKQAIRRKRLSCQKHGIPCDLDEQYLTDLWNSQRGLCYYANIPLELGTNSPCSATLERLEGSCGYVRGNIVFASKAMNLAKNSATISAFQQFLSHLLVGLTHPVRLECKHIDQAAQQPHRHLPDDAGLDLTTIRGGIIEPHSRTMFPTGLRIAAPPGFYYTIEGRSSLHRQGIVPFRAIIDGGYNGELEVGLINHGTAPYSVHSGDKIAQLLMHRNIIAEFAEVIEFGPEYSSRGEQGFGSSGR